MKCCEILFEEVGKDLEAQLWAEGAHVMRYADSIINFDKALLVALER